MGKSAAQQLRPDLKRNERLYRLNMLLTEGELRCVYSLLTESGDGFPGLAHATKVVGDRIDKLNRYGT